MIIPMDKLLRYEKNKYEFTRAIMAAFEKVGNIREYPEDDKSWKVVPNVLDLALNDYFSYDNHTRDIED